MMARRRRQMSLVVLWSTVLGASACSSDDSPAGGNEDTTADTSSDTTADTAADTVDTNVGPPPAERAYYSIRRRFDFARPGEPTPVPPWESQRASASGQPAGGPSCA